MLARSVLTDVGAYNGCYWTGAAVFPTGDTTDDSVKYTAPLRVCSIDHAVEVHVDNWSFTTTRRLPAAAVRDIELVEENEDTMYLLDVGQGVCP